MTNVISRRIFIKSSAAVGGAALLAGCTGPGFLFRRRPDIAVVQGVDYFAAAVKAVELLGGMDRFVPGRSRIGLLINSAFDEVGAFVNPDISLAVVKMCFEAGADEVCCIQYVAPEYWQRSGHAADMADETGKLKNTDANRFPAEFNEESWKIIEIPKAVSMKTNVEVIKAIYDCDVFINIFIAKHHASTLYTGALKNMMGICTRKTNVRFHLEGPERNDPVFLAQCIADINLVRKPDLIIGDATEFIVNNGPDGPGDIEKLQKVIAGTDIVAVDSLCTGYHGYKPGEILTVQRAFESGLGEQDYTVLKIKEVEL
ncbi:MAG: DUF362 domain-containing protein [Bacteroidetes bacterium]|nr:DUF362 domain-containing protein [Bacteroidota bacterium]